MGQVPHGGHNQPGLNRFIKIKNENEEGRENSADLEAKVLKKIWEIYNISDTDVAKMPAQVTKKSTGFDDKLAESLDWNSE